MYTPGAVPYPYDGLWLQAELRRLAESLEQGDDRLRVATTNVAPTKVLEGTIRIADGVNWDPGRGAGVYIYRNGDWQLIEGGFTANLKSKSFFLSD